MRRVLKVRLEVLRFPPKYCVNEALHGIYPTNFNGIIVRDYFDMKAALKDVEQLYALKKGSAEDDELNILTG